MTADLHARLLDRLAELDGDIPMDGGMGPALRAVVELHAPDTFVIDGEKHAECTGCDMVDGVRAAYPCETIRTIAEYLGVTEGDHR